MRILFIAVLFIFFNLNYAAAEAGRYNIILISVDSLRPDHLGCYGYRRNTSPEIDAFAKDAIVFENAFCQGTWTLPSHASIFTSRYPFVHGAGIRVPPFGLDGLNEVELTLAEILKGHGYKTAAFTGGNHVRAELGFKQGFDTYYDTVDWTWVNRGMLDTTVPLALKWLEDNRQNNFFLFLHGFDVHFPYNYSESSYEKMFNPAYEGIIDKTWLVWGTVTRIFQNRYIDESGRQVKFSPKDVAHIIARYDGGVRHADSYVGKFLKKIKEMGLSDNTIILILSDHGMELFEHGHVGWCYSPYDEVLRIPLIIKHPGLKEKHKRIAATAQLIDVMPTILGFLALPVPPEAQGTNLLPAIEGKVLDGFNEYIYAQYGSGVVRSRKWKYIAKYELYDLENDPGERHNLINKQPEIAIEYLQRLKDIIKDGNALINMKRLKMKTSAGPGEYGYW